MPRASRYPDDLRERLVAEAARRVRDSGPDRVSVRDLAAALSTSTNAIYAIFGGKDPLLVEVAALVRAEMRARQRGVAAATGGADGVRAVARDQRAWALENPGHHALLTTRFGGDPWHGVAAPDDPLVPLVEACLAEGVCVDGDVRGIVATIRAAVLGYVTLELQRPASGLDPDAAEERFDAHLDRVLHGVLAPAPAVA